MGQLHDREAWESALPNEIVSELEEWLDDEPFSLHHQEWFTEGRTSGPVARVMRTTPYRGDSADDSEQVVLKFFDAHGPERVANIRQAWRVSDNFHAHLAEPEDQVIRLKDWRAVFMRVAGGNLDTVRPLGERRTDYAEFPGYCETIVRAVVRKWNRNRLPREPRTVSAVVNDIMGGRRQDAESWARSASLAVDDKQHAVVRANWPEPLRNPFTLVAGETGDRTIKALFFGTAHGDLSGRNIFVPTKPSVSAKSFVLIDYDRFSERAPLARDPMHLLVALVLDEFNDIASKWRVDLARVLVDPDTRGIPPQIEHIRKLSAAIHMASAPKAAKGWGWEWTRQCLLSLAGVGLVHLGRKLHVRDQDAAKEWCFHLAAMAGDAYIRMDADTDHIQVLPVPAPSAVRSAIRPGSPVDRKDELLALRARLTNGPWGVVMLRGPRGVGKTTLVDVTLDDLKAGSTPPRIYRHNMHPATHLDARTLTDYVAGETDATAPFRYRGSPLVRLEAALQRLGDSRIVVAVDSAENLVDRTSKELTDPELDDVFELLATQHRHRVTVLLVTQRELISPGAGTWPDEPPIVIDGLPLPEFFTYFESLDHNGRMDFSGFSQNDRRDLYDKLQGNPRHAELAHAVLVVAESGLDLRALTDRLLNQDAKDVLIYLTGLLVDGLSPLRLRVLQALAAFDTPVPEAAVLALVNDDDPKVRQALSTLVSHRVVYRAGSDKYFVPSEDGRLILEPTPGDTRSDLYFAAATVLTDCRSSDPHTVAELEVHFAELRALLRSQRYAAAYNMIEAINDLLHEWNCNDLLLDQRKEVKDKLNDEHLEMANDNALAGIYVTRGDYGKASAAFGRAMKVAETRRDDASKMKLHANLAEMHWQWNDIDLALSHFEFARDEADRLGDLTVRMGALEGIADCNRRRGRYGEAILLAEQALAVPGLTDYPDEPPARSFATRRSVAIALKLARWYGELGRPGDAARLIEVAHEAATARGDDWLRAAVRDGRADQLFNRGEFDVAESFAVDAVNLALEIHDRIILLQARTTLALIYLKWDRQRDARHEIEGAWRHRRPGRSLLVLALRALADRQKGDRRSADKRFDQLLAEATARTTCDSDDFAAWDFRGFAHCGKDLDTRNSLTEAIEAFRAARRITRLTPTPVLVDRLRFLLTQLDGSRPGRLQTAIDALSDPGR